MYMSLAGPAVDFHKFEWYANNTKQSITINFDDKVPVQLQPDDLVGINRITKGAHIGSYQVVLARYPQRVFRAVPATSVSTLQKSLIPINFVPEKPAAQGIRRTKITHQKVKQSDRLTADYYKSRPHIVETDGVDREDYQWRRIVRPVRVNSRHTKKILVKLEQDDKVGLRFIQPAHGGFILLPDGRRVALSFEDYTKVVQNSDILSRSEQLDGLFYPDSGPVSSRPLKEKVSRKRVVTGSRNPDLYKELKSRYDYNNLDDDELDFEPEDEVHEEIMQHAEDILSNPDEEESADEFEPEIPEDGLMAAVGQVFEDKHAKQWTVVHIEPQDLVDVLYLYDGKNSVRHYKVHAGIDMSTLKPLTYVKTLNEEQIEQVIEKAGNIDPQIGEKM